MALLTNIIADINKDFFTGIANGEEIGIAYDLADAIVNGIVIGKADGKANTIAT